MNPPNYIYQAYAPGWLDTVLPRQFAQHPLVTRAAQTSDGRARAVSDVYSRQQWVRTELFNEGYRIAFGGTYWDSVFIGLNSPPAKAISRFLAIHRNRPFTDHDKTILNLLRPHLRQAFLNAQAITKLQRELGALQRTVEAIHGGVILLGEEEQITFITPRAQQWLIDYFDKPRQIKRLPEELERWARYQKCLLSMNDDFPSTLAPLIVPKQGKQLIVRWLPESAGNLLLLEEKREAAPAAELEKQLGLSHREAEVLYWVAQGKTNKEIGVILSMSPRTAQKHLERVFEKLGVENRTTATTIALGTVKQTL
jgi:DNA-binding CsgD family transcriptional regulator